MRKTLSLEDYIKGIENGDIAVLSRAITLVESKNVEHQKLARELVREILPKSGGAVRLGISGAPGVGKSTFIESFGKILTKKKLKVAVLAVDPTSQITGGSILGDKTRMNELAIDPLSFIRPSPSGSSLGGVASRTWESMLLCEAFGFDVIIVETVGVGQSETAVARITDFFLLLMQPGGGDDLQGIKRGIMEMADIICINKADGDQLNQAKLSRSHLENAVSILRSEKRPKVLLCSSTEKSGLKEIWDETQRLYKEGKEELEGKRSKQLGSWIKDMVIERIQFDFDNDEVIKLALEKNHQEVSHQKKSALDAANDIYETFKKKN